MNTRAVAALALALLWYLGLFGRVYWTPDEPREAALAVSVSKHPAALPSLAGVHFAEKPPLTYWLAGASMKLFGPGPAATRLPQLFYAILAFMAVATLAGSLLGNDSKAPAVALAAGMLFATSELVYQVQIWLDTDALLLVGVCIALTGMCVGLGVAGHGAVARHARLRGYLVMHAGLTLAFFAKNFAAWLVPVLAFLCFIAWERRWRELLRWEFYLGALLPLVCIALWVKAVASMPDGAHSLRVLFWNNLVGRAVPVAAEAQFNYSSGHRNWFGRYFVELPLDLLPWTALAFYALKGAWRGGRVAGPRRAAWRFALCTALPGLIVLSLAATARSIYAAPCMIGFMLLIALWIADSTGGRANATAVRRALSITALLIALWAAIVLAGTIALQWTVASANWPVFATSALAAAAVAVWSLRQCFGYANAGAGKAAATLSLQLAAAWALLLSLGVLSLFDAMNRSQDLAAMAARVIKTAESRPLLLWSPDETTRAWAQLYLPADHWSVVDGADPAAADKVAQRLRIAPATTVVSMIPGGGWSRTAWLDYLLGRAGAAGLTEPDGVSEPALRGAGLAATAQVERPGGRGYILWQQTRILQ